VEYVIFFSASDTLYEDKHPSLLLPKRKQLLQKVTSMTAQEIVKFSYFLLLSWQHGVLEQLESRSSLQTGRLERQTRKKATAY